MRNNKGRELQKILEYIDHCVKDLQDRSPFTNDPTSYKINFSYEISKLGSGTIANSISKDTSKKGILNDNSKRKKV